MIEVKKAPEYSEWFDDLTDKEQLKVDARISRIEKYEHFGDAKHIGDGLLELRWKNGWRVYFSFIGNKKIILILGGHKNDQEKDIKKARNFIRKHTTH